MQALGVGFDAHGSGVGLCAGFWTAVVKNSGLATLHRPFVGLGTRRTGKSPGKFWARENGRPKDVVKPELLTTGNVPLGHRAR